MRRVLVVLGVCVLTAIAPWITLFGVNLAAQPPTAVRSAERCTRHCHHRGCTHEPILPGVLTSDEGLFGLTIEALFEIGGHSGLGRTTGYTLANLAIFVVIWPALMLGLLAVVVWQRSRIRETRRDLSPGESL